MQENVDFTRLVGVGCKCRRGDEGEADVLAAVGRAREGVVAGIDIGGRGDVVDEGRKVKAVGYQGDSRPCHELRGRGGWGKVLTGARSRQKGGDE